MSFRLAVLLPTTAERLLPRKRNRGAKTAIELFVASVREWEDRLQELVGTSADGK
jgi:hypothetical protein